MTPFIQRMLALSTRITQSISSRPFVMCILSRLSFTDVTVQLNLLKILLVVYRNQTVSKRKELPPIQDIVAALKAVDSLSHESVLVMELARLLREF